MIEAYLGLGANQGSPRAQLEAALELLARDGRVRVLGLSGWYRTAPVGGPPGQPDFVNAVARLATVLEPHALLARLLAVERALGRDRAAEVRHGPRPVDLDLLLYGNLRLASRELVVPHPRLWQRAFVLVPLAELAPDLVPPGSELCVRELCAALDCTGVRPLEEPREPPRAPRPAAPSPGARA